MAKSCETDEILYKNKIKRMRIGILTLPFNNNYGGYLQAYALMTVLKRMGYEVELIYRRHNRIPLLTYIKHFVFTLIKCAIGRKHGDVILNQEKRFRDKGELLMTFLNDKISPKTEPLFSSKELAKKCKGRYDVIIVGSDQVWRPDYVPDIKDFFLDFAKRENIIRIAYAASFGERHPQYSSTEMKICGNLLTSFDAIGLREESGREVIEDFHWKCRKNPEIVLDPTILLDKVHYESLFPQGGIRQSYVLSYVLDDSKEVQNFINSITTKLNLPEKKIIDSKQWKKHSYKMPSMESWLKAIHNAIFVVTDSFHGTVFCILFNIPFAVYVNKGRGADRFYTLLKHFGLEHRIMSSEMDVLNIIQSKIQWNDVNTILVEKRNTSMKFLLNAIDSR